MLQIKIIAQLSLTLCLFLFINCENKKQKDIHKPRILVSTDIGGTDYDDYQSMVHLLVYADTFDIEGIIASPYGKGRKSDILKVVNAYEKDYSNLKTYSNSYPSADSIRKIVKQGAEDLPSIIGFNKPTEGSNWIIKCAKKSDSRPLNILIWGGLEDLAQALHDAPEILPKLRVFFIGGPNKKWSVNAYQYIANNFKDLWIIESNSTYFGWFVGGYQKENYSNKAFLEKNIKNKGALGAYFFEIGKNMKMGDTPSLTYFLQQNPYNPSNESWGGQYVKAWERPFKSYNRITTQKDSIEEFGVLELRLPYTDTVKKPYAYMNITNQSLKASIQKDTIRFLFSPKQAADWSYTIESNIHSINHLKGELISYSTPEANLNKPSPEYPNWWVDNPLPEFKEGEYIGAKTVNKWRKEFLDDFAKRMKRCQSPKN